MFEKLKIKYFGHQPAAKITNRTLNRILQREFSDNFKEVNEKLKLINSDTPKGKNRLSAAVLKLANRDLTKIDPYIEMCNNDYRDVVSQAEYPKRFKFNFDETDHNKLKKIYLDDWTEYSNWINKD